MHYFRQLEQQKIQRYLCAKRLFIDLMNECPVAFGIFNQLDNDEDIINLMIIARDYIFGTAMSTKNLDDIEFLLEFIEDLHDQLDNPEVDLKFTLDDIDDLLFSEPYLKQRQRRGERVQRRRQHYTPTRKHISQYHKGNLRKRPHYRVLC
jgi:hypothetical protein